MTRDSQAIWMPSPYSTSGRNGFQPHYIILHGTAGGTSATAIANWFRSTNPASNVSAHYIIGQDGMLIQCVDEDDWAWANGFLSAGHDPWWQDNINPNWVTISIEHVKSAVDNSNALTDAQKLASFALIKRICQRWDIPMRAADGTGGITGHYSIDPVNRSQCPGTFPWDELWSVLKGSETMLDLSDPVVKRYFVDGGSGTWKCTVNNVTMLGGILTFYRSNGGPALLGLPLSNELSLAQYPVIRIVPCERALIIYDPSHQIDNPPIQGPCYLLHINQGIGQQMVARALTDPLNALIQKLQAQLQQLPAQQMSQQLQDYASRLNQIKTLSTVS